MNSLIDLPGSDMLKALPPDGGPDYNRLVFEKSPYLLQHARNPVDWYAWGETAFQAARELDRPIFLSIGYSTCHWCHVMEKESFEDQAVADLLNAGFISIKVDREERPDIDQLYMSVCQLVTGRGGWPLTVILTPDRLPFFAGTYFPKKSRFGRTGMLDLLPKVVDLWNTKRSQLLESATGIVNELNGSAALRGGEIHPNVFQAAYEGLQGRYDRLFGGFGPAPKFPAAHTLIYLMRYWHRTGESEALEMVERTLTQMRLGGIFDQVGFGFHRYSTDEAWLLPHFEKMLYDQAMLAMAYTEAYLATGKQRYGQVAREVLNYVLRDMTSPAGGFFSAEDADSEGEEGLFYQWTTAEFRELLDGPGDDLFLKILNLSEGGNYYDEADKTRTGRNILYLKRDLPDLADEFQLSADQLAQRWEDLRLILFQAREGRVHPLKDDKVLTDWNGLMVAALAKASAAFDDPGYLAAAKKAADFIWTHLRQADRRLQKRFRDGVAGQPAHLDDYAFLVWGLIEIFQADFDPVYLSRALELNDVMLEDFWDDQAGGLFLSNPQATDLILRSKEMYDGALPSGNSVAAHNLIRLARLTGRQELESKAQQIAQVFAEQVNSLPQGFTHFLGAMLLAESPAYEVVICGDSEAEDTRQMLRALQERYFPNLVVLLNPQEAPQPPIWELAPWLKDQAALGGKATAYVCQEFSCFAPTVELEEMLHRLS